MMIKSFVFNAFGVNAYIIYDETREAVIIDGAVNSDREFALLKQFVDDNSLCVKYLVNTHGHLDHICGNKRLKSEWNAPVLANEKDNNLFETVMESAYMFGFKMEAQSLPDKSICDGDVIVFGNSSLKVLEVPGHSKGSVALFSEKENAVFSGDALFRESIGRTDLKGGNYSVLLDSIESKLFCLNEDCVVYPGHGESSTIGHEKNFNPFF
ncbi:MAG: MBL fold metallo-hydrolase [Bacteroidales bacterium]|nr:MBL fold metallo-hydrolase [Bacteroidales bacterium]